MEKTISRKNIRALGIIIITLFFLSSVVSAQTYGIHIKTSGCRANQTLPDSNCTPGAVLTTDTSIVCVSGYTNTVRNVSLSTKKKVFKEYGIPWALHSNYEVDHLISLELGGSNDIANLFPESYLIKNNARVKDSFENYLHKQVCNGSITIEEAQRETSTDWMKYEQLRRGYVSPPPVSTKKLRHYQFTTQVAPPLKTETLLPSTNTANVINSTEPAVKKSKSGICHDKTSPYYARTENYTAYGSIADCIASGGRLPKIKF